MTKISLQILSIACVLFLSACTLGSSTTERPALEEPPVGADGFAWDIVDAGRDNDTAKFRSLVSVRMVHRAILPDAKRNDVKTFDEQDAENLRLAEELKQYENTKARLYQAYMSKIRKLASDRYVEMDKPRYKIQYRDGFNRAWGPNRATILVKFWPKRSLAPNEQPIQSVWEFVQDHDEWKLISMSPDPLKGTFSRG